MKAKTKAFRRFKEWYIMKKTIRKIMAILLCVLPLFGASPAAFAAENTAYQVTTPFEHNSDGDYYYMPDNNLEGSYTYFYEEIMPMTVMFADCVQVPFEYDGQKWLIQLTKGQYGFLLVGSDIVVFTADKSADSFEDYCLATDDNRLEIKLSCSRKKDEGFEEIFNLESAKHSWANGFAKGQLSNFTPPFSELKTYAEITFKSEEMAKLFADGLKTAGFRESVKSAIIFEDSFYRDGAKIVLSWSDVSCSADCQDIILNRNELSLKPGETYQLNAEIIPSMAVNSSVFWISSNEKVAAVDENGVVTAKSYGMVTISAVSPSGIKADCVITVEDDSVKCLLAKIIETITIWFIRIFSIFTF